MWSSQSSIGMHPVSHVLPGTIMTEVLWELDLQPGTEFLHDIKGIRDFLALYFFCSGMLVLTIFH